MQYPSNENSEYSYPLMSLLGQMCYNGWKLKISEILNLKIKVLKLAVCLHNINSFKFKWSIVFR